MGMHGQAMVECRPKKRWDSDEVIWWPAIWRSIGVGRSGTDHAIGMRSGEGLETRDLPGDMSDVTKSLLTEDGWFNSGEYGDMSGCCRFTHLSLVELEAAVAAKGYKVGTDEGWQKVHDLMRALDPIGDVRVLVGWAW